MVAGVEENFRERACALVAQIPRGRVMTYGDIAAICGNAYAARIVGGIAHFGTPNLPWQRVVNRFGGLASGYYGGRRQQQIDLEKEGVAVCDGRVADFAQLRWSPFEHENSSGVTEEKLPLIVIVGPTASGKTGLAIELAKNLRGANGDKIGGEIISADSRAIYRGMDIGTAKPTRAEQKQVKHWGIDLVAPNEKFTVADFQKYTNEKIREIRARGKIPFLVGGSGLYVDAVIFGYEFGGVADAKLREKLDKMTVAELQNYCEKHNIPLPQNRANKRYLMRAIERQTVVKSNCEKVSANAAVAKNNRAKIRGDAIVVGIATDKDELRERIATRARAMFNSGIEAETEKLFAQYAPNFDGSPASFVKLPEALKSNIYQFVWRELCGEISRDEAVKLFEIDDRHLAKKQLTWFRRNPNIKWLPLNAVEKYVLGAYKTVPAHKP